MTKSITPTEEELRQICTYYSELGEGTAGYSLSEDQFKKVMALITKEVEKERERIRKILANHIRNGDIDMIRVNLDQLRAELADPVDEL